MRKEQLLQAAVDRFAALGFAGASIKRIAEAAGLAPGLVHYYFPNKEALLLGALETIEPPEVTTLEDWIFTRLEDRNEPAARCFLAVMEASLSRPNVAAALEAMLQRESALVARLLAQEGIPEAHAPLLMATATGFLQLGLSHPSLIPTGSAAPSVRALVASWR